MAGLAAGALAAGAIASALIVPTGPSIDNVIAAGHLSVEVNHGQGSDLDFSNLAPGDSRTGDQLITGDMAGVASADLVLTLSGAQDGPFADHATLTVRSSDPEPSSSAKVDSATCSPADGYQYTATFPMSELTTATGVPLGTLTSAATAVCVRFEVALDTAADNSVQDASVALALNYTLTQTSVGSP